MIRVELPIKTAGGLNARLHWAQRAKAVRRERDTACMFVRGAAMKHKLQPPVTITLTRISPGTLDDDNLQGALKAIRDGVADAFHVADNDKRIRWQYAQEKCARKMYGVRIELVAVDDVRIDPPQDATVESAP